MSMDHSPTTASMDIEKNRLTGNGDRTLVGSNMFTGTAGDQTCPKRTPYTGLAQVAEF